ncbi:hypothetical protein TNCV_3102071 [Trichonephila clavipes]|nr:hypothetical protein TNCV_3102071 [Trichonephila clavipes]
MTRSHLVGLAEVLNGILYILKDSRHVTYPPVSYRFSSSESSAEGTEFLVHQTLHVTRSRLTSFSIDTCKGCVMLYNH